METEVLNQAIKSYLQQNPWIYFALLWTIIWKLLALWQAARRSQKVWFVALFIINTLGILEIIYLLTIRHQEKNRPINPLAPKNFTPPKNPNLP